MQQERFFYRICADEAADLMRNPGLQILDTRDRKSFDQGHLESARHVTGTELEQTILQIPKGKPVLIYCHRGSASLTHAQMFADFGFTEVYSLNGGYDGWIRWQSAGQQVGLAATGASERLRVWLAAQGFPVEEIK